MDNKGSEANEVFFAKSFPKIFVSAHFPKVRFFEPFHVEKMFIN